MARKKAVIEPPEETVEDLVEDPRALDVLRGLYQRDGKLTPQTVLDAARDPGSPLHGRFEWDDVNAAHQYRLQQARQIIRVTMTVVAETKVRAFVHVASASTYAPVEEAMARPDWREEVLKDFERDADRFRARWSAHRHVADAYRAWVQSQAAAS